MSQIQPGQFDTLADLEPTAGDCRGTDTQAGGDERRLRVVRHGVLVHGDMGTAQGRIGVLAGQALTDQADQEQVVIGAAGHYIVATFDENVGHGLGVVDHLLLVGLEARLQRFLEAHGLGGDHVHQRAALGTREYCGVELFLDLFVGLGQDQAATRTAQGLVWW